MRLLFRTFALLAVFPYLGVVLLLMTGAASWSRVAYVVATGALLAGLGTVRDADGPKGRRPRGLSRGAALAIALVAIVRMVVAGEGRSIRMGESARFVNRLVDEG